MFLTKIIKLPGLRGVYLNSLFRGMGQYLINFFVPIYLYKLKGSLADVLIFYILCNLIVVLSGFFSTAIIRKIGVDWSSFIGALLRILYFLSLSLIPWHWLFFYLAAIFSGLKINFYWIPFHYTVISLDDGDKKYGKEASMVTIAEKIALVLGPIIGGAVIRFFGFSYLFLLAGIFIFISGVILFFDNFTKKGMDFSTRRIIKDLLGKKRRKIWLGLTGYSIETFIATILWPLFIYFHISSIIKVGFVQGLSLVVALGILFLVGKRVDKKGYGVVKFGLIILTINWLLRIFISSSASIVASNIFSEFGSILLWLPFSAWIYSKISIERKTEFLLEREMVIHIVETLLCVFLLITKNNFNWLLVFSLAISALFMTAGGIYLESKTDIKQ